MSRASRVWRGIAAAAVFAAALAAAQCGGNSPTAPTGPTGPPVPPIAPPPPPLPPPPNTAPTIGGITLSSERADVDQEITVTALVTDEETPVDQLAYEWTADGGSFNGTGREVRWRAPDRDTKSPAEYGLKLTVTERYEVRNEDESWETKEQTASATATVRFNNNRKEVSDIAGEFITDFANSNVSPQACVRNFSDRLCGRGKAEELQDIVNNRNRYVIVSSSWAITDIRFNDAKDAADITARCEFVSTVRATGAREVARGTCLLTAVYDDWRWWLCDSRFRGTTTSGAQFIF
jgi:hypothetical protein